MSFTVPCPRCDARLSVRDDLRGKKGRCPACRAVIELNPPEDAVDEPENREPVPGEPQRPAATPTPVPISSAGQGFALARRRTSRGVKMLLCCLAVVGLAAVFPWAKGSKPSVNPLQSLANGKLQDALNRAVAKDGRNHGIDVDAYYVSAFDQSTVVFDLQDVTGAKSRLDVFRLFLDFADEAQGESCEWVVLAFRGKPRFKLDGAYFRQLGRERSYQNPAYTIRTFPEHLKTPSGQSAYPEWTGGWLGVLQKQMDDANDFHDRWYLNDLEFAL